MTFKDNVILPREGLQKHIYCHPNLANLDLTTHKVLAIVFLYS